MVKRHELTRDSGGGSRCICLARQAIRGALVPPTVYSSGVVCVLCSGTHWHELPERYGQRKTADKRRAISITADDANDLML